MRPALRLVLAALAGLVTGGVAMLALQAPAAVVDDPADPAGPQEAGSLDDAALPDTADRPALPAPPATSSPLGSDDRLLLVWAAGGLPDGLAAAVADLPQVAGVTAVAGDVVDLVASHVADGTPVGELDEGWAIPLDVLAIDPAAYASFLPKADHATVGALQDGEALLGATSARLRELGPGDTLTVEGETTLTVRDVIDDALVGAAELVVTRDDGGRIGVSTDRFLLVGHSGERAALEQAIRQATDVEVRVRAPGETPFLRHGDGVLPQSHVKAVFGEFAYRRSPGQLAFAQDPTWVADNLATFDLPGIGEVRCHRNISKQVVGALTELAAGGLDHLVDPDQYAGCHDARLIAAGSGVSRHAWGIAIDLNAEDNRHGDPPDQDRRLVDVMARWGFTWGGFWLVPDAMHFEYVGPPEPEAAKVDPHLD